MKCKCDDCKHQGYKFPYERGGCYDCDSFYSNFKPKEVSEK